ncbi:MAG: hypothetical protein NVS4B12_25400 [Ktedonobacteraceae bacterium]
MLETLLIGSITGVVVAIITSLIIVRIYQRNLNNVLIQQQAWERAQEERQQQWQHQQEKRAVSFEKKLATNVQQVQQEWHAWEHKDTTRVQMLEQQYEAATTRTILDNKLKHIPHLEEAPMLPIKNQQHESVSNSASRTVQLQGADLAGRDLSRRYLRGANLRGANLAQANLFMADLSHACLVGADLSSADLSGSNLTGADLQDATLSGANVLVADVNNAVLRGANLSSIRNLTAEQLATTIYDNTTQFEEDTIDRTLPQLPSIPKSVSAAVPSSMPSTPLYDIVIAQGLNAVPEMPSETPSATQNILEPDISTWSLLPSEDALRIMEDLHQPAERQQRRRTETFGPSNPEEIQNGRRSVRTN